MTYFKIDDTDYSNYVGGLKILNSHNYNSQINAAGNTVVDYINTKRTIEVMFIPLNETVMAQLLTKLHNFNVNISFRNPNTNILENNVSCIIPQEEIEFYTIQVNNVSYKNISLTFIEL